MGERVAGLRPISTSPVKIHSCSMIVIVIVAGLLRPSYTSTIYTKIINPMILRERVSGLLRPISTSNIVTAIINSEIERGIVYGIKINIPKYPITRRQFKTSVIIDTVGIAMGVGEMSGLTRSIS